MAGDRPDEFQRHVTRVRCGEPDADRPIDTGNRFQKVGKIERAIAIGIDVLSKKRDFLESPRGECLDFLHDSGKRPAPLPAPGEGHDAERTELVASPHNRDPGANAVSPERRDVVIGFNAGESDRYSLLSIPCVPKKGGGLSVLIRTDNQIDGLPDTPGPFAENL